MFLIDDILFAPAKGLLWIFEEIRKRAEEEMKDTPEKLKKELLDLQGLLEEGRISERVYLRREQDILERLGSLKSTRKK